jgi:glucose/arabinose dehydrogenase
MKRLLAYGLTCLAVVPLNGCGVGAEHLGPILDPRALSAPSAHPQIRVIDGYKLSIFAEGLGSPRHMTRRGNEVWVAERTGQRVLVLRDLDGDGYAEDRVTAASGYFKMHGIDYFKGWFYFSTQSTVYRFRDDNRDRVADAAPEAIITDLPTEGHTTRTVRVNPFNEKLYVHIGSSSNLDIEPAPRATIRQYNLDGTKGREFAGDLRNAVGVSFDPKTGEMWVVNSGWDNLGDLLPHECMWRVADGQFFGWPYAYSHNGVVMPDPTFGPSNPAKVAATKVADWEFAAHTTPLGITFWRGTRWGVETDGAAFVAFHGSYVPFNPVGYEVGRVTFDPVTLRPVGFTTMVTNFRQGNATPVGRPVDVLQFGSALLISDDYNGKIYRLDKLS